MSLPLRVVSEPLHVVFPCGLIWASSQHGKLRGSWTAHMATPGVKGEYSSVHDIELGHIF